jgi:hypothetical protein
MIEAADQQSVHRTGPRAPRIATAAAGARGALRAPAARSPDREGREGLFQVRALATRALGRLLPAQQHLETGSALAARVLVNGHARIIAGRDFLCEIRNLQSAIGNLRY